MPKKPCEEVRCGLFRCGLWDGSPVAKVETGCWVGVHTFLALLLLGMGIPPRLAYLVHLVRRSILKHWPSNIRQAVGPTTAEPPEPLNLPEPHQTPHRNLRNLPEPARNHEPPCSVENLKKHFIVYLVRLVA